MQVVSGYVSDFPRVSISSSFSRPLSRSWESLHFRLSSDIDHFQRRRIVSPSFYQAFLISDDMPADYSRNRTAPEDLLGKQSTFSVIPNKGRPPLR